MENKDNRYLEAEAATFAFITNQQYLGLKETRYQIEQGRLMQPASPSLIETELEPKNNEVQRLWVGGIGKVVYT